MTSTGTIGNGPTLGTGPTIGRGPNVGRGAFIGKPPSPQQANQVSSNSIANAFDRIYQRSAIIQQQADQIVYGELERQADGREDLFRLFDLVG